MMKKEVRYNTQDLVKITSRSGYAKHVVNGRVEEIMYDRGYFVYTDFESGRKRTAHITDIQSHVDDKIAHLLCRLDTHSLLKKH